MPEVGIHIQSSAARLGLTLALMLLSIGGNFAGLPLLFGVEFIFGSVAVMLGLLMLGVIPAVMIAAAGSLYTVMAWGHPYAMVIFILEALIVGLVHRRRGDRLVLLDLGYWLLIGMPLVFMFYGGVMGMAEEAVNQIALKQMLNGVSNALWASILFLGTRWILSRRGAGERHRLGLGDVLFHAFLTLILLAGAPPLLYDAYSHYYEEQQRITDRLAAQNNTLERYLGRSELDYHVSWIRENTEGLGQTLLLDNGRTVVTSGEVASVSRAGAGEVRELNPQLDIWLPSGDMPVMDQWKQGRFVSRNRVDVPGNITAVVSELPAAPLIASVQSKYVTLFGLLTVIVILGVTVSLLMTRWLTAPIRALAHAGVSLDTRIAQGQPPELPGSRIQEFDQLSNTLSDMSNRLVRAFNRLQESRAAVEREVEQRTRELNDTATLLRSVLDAATEFAIVATDPGGRITIFNSGAERLLGYPPDALGSGDTPAIFHDPGEIRERRPDLASGTRDPQALFDALISEARDSGLDSGEWTWVRRDGERFPVWLIQTPIRSDEGQITGYLLMAEDITELRKAERMKDDFIATVSHELRTPLTSVSGSIRLLTGGAAGELPPKAQQMLVIAERNISHLHALVSDLLDIEKLAAGKMRFKLQTQNLIPLLRHTVENHAGYASQRDVTIGLSVPEEPVQVSVDAQRLEQALSNLLSNAIKFSPRGITSR